MVAPEHLRRATSEEIGDAFVLRTTQADLEKLLELNPDEIVFEDSEQLEGDPELPLGEDDTGEPRGGGQVRDADHLRPVASVSKRYRTKGPPDAQLVPIPEGDDDLDLQEPDHEMPAASEAMMLKRAKTARGREKPRTSSTGSTSTTTPLSLYPLRRAKGSRRRSPTGY